MKPFLLVTVLLLSGAATVFAQTNVLEDATSQSVSNVWTVAEDLLIGVTTSSNSMQVINGGDVTVNHVFIGGANATNSYLLVQGSNAVMSVNGNLEIDGYANYAQVADGGSLTLSDDLLLASENLLLVGSNSVITLGGDMTVSSNTLISGSGRVVFTGAAAALTFNGTPFQLDDTTQFEAQGAGSQVAVNDGTFEVSGSLTNRFQSFDALNLNNSTLSGSGAVDSFASVTMTGGVLEPGGSESAGRLEIAGDFSAVGTVYKADIYATQTDELAFTGANPVDLSGISAEISVHQAPTGAVTTLLTSDAGFNNALADVTISDSLLLYDADVEVNADGTMTVNVEANNKKFSSALTYAGVESVRAGFNAMKGSVFARTKQLRGNMVATAHSIPHDAYLLSNPEAPEAPDGPQGPGDQNTVFGMSAWIQQFGGKGEYDASGISDGYSLYNIGTTFGFDKVLGEGLVAGLNYTYARSTARTSNRDKLDVETYWLGAYAQWVNESGLYVDSLVALARSNYDSERVEASESYAGTGSFRGYNVGAYADVGQYYHHKNLALSPYAGLHYLTVNADSYTESQVDSVNEMEVGAQKNSTLAAVLGLKLRYRFDTDAGRFQTTAFAEYEYDVIQEDIYATLTANGLAAVNMGKISPDEKTVNTGFGFSWMCTDNLEVGLGYGGRFSDRYEEHSISGMLNMRF